MILVSAFIFSADDLLHTTKAPSIRGHMVRAAIRNANRATTFATRCRLILRRMSFFHQMTYPKGVPSKKMVTKPYNCQT
jgi:hypothetical protein